MKASPTAVFPHEGIFTLPVHAQVRRTQNADRAGPMRSSLFNDVKLTGPIRFQGDDGPVAFRNLKIRKLSLE